MKRLSKLLVLLLTLAILVTAFTVIALADEEKTIPTPMVSLKDYNEFEDGATIQNGSSKKGAAYAVKQDDGNVYMLMTYEDGTGGNSENIDTGVAKNYITKYPYAVISFDIMSPQGQHASDHFFMARLYKANSSVGYFLNAGIYFNNIGLSNTPYDWQHVSVVIEMDPETFYFHQYVYVNGEYVTTVTETSLAETIGGEDYDRSKLSISYMKFSASRTSSEADKDTAIDNFRFSHFPAGATIDEMANYFYKDWQPLYKYTVGTLNDAYYDDFDKLLSAAGDTDVIKLKADVTDVIINENVIIDTNIYGEDGVTVTGNYKLDFISTEGYVAKVENGIYTIEKSNQLVDVLWDPACSEDCDCLAEYGGHKMTLSTISVIGQLPAYPNDCPTFEIVNGLKREFIGWSYENDGTADDIHPVTAEEVAAGAITLYPVYKSTQYAIEYVNGNSITYHFADEFTTVLGSHADGATI
ncbi:MAG: hypothetical protein IKV16_01565, partial [Clostridia bacterium]|nr:hypothetical protein [Clostridia bacterium]